MTIKKIILLVLLNTLPFACKAYDVMLRIEGAIGAGGCTLSTKQITVGLGSITDEKLSSTAPNGEIKNFQLRFEKCTADTGGVRVSFNGLQDIKRPELFAINTDASSASGVGIAILDTNKNIIQPNQPGSFIPFQDPQTPEHTLDFYAQYQVNTDVIRAGKADAAATFTVEYQ